MKNEPVAWTDGKGNYFDKNSFFPFDDLIPLYTHPAKTLTDEEIIEIRDSCYVESGLDEWEYCDIEFARAILRKAQEK
jgi:hypothetical protein